MFPEHFGVKPQEFMSERGQERAQFDWRNGEIPESEVRYMTSRAGGPGGQGVNTTDSRVELRWMIGGSLSLSKEQKMTVRVYAITKARRAMIEEDDELRFVCASERSQLQNKRDCLDKLNVFLRQALTPEEERIATKKSKGVKTRERRASEADKRRKAGRRQVKDWD